MLQWSLDSVNSEYRPTLYPGEDTHKWEIPEEVSSDFHKLSAVIESKYSREFLKVCAFYNKMFPSIRGASWSRSSYNVPPFTVMEQERSDTGNGTNYNYLKQIVDQITSRLGTVSFTPKLLSEEQSYEYILYKPEVERVLRKLVKNDDLNRLSLEAFHDAAVLNYSHVFIDPFTHDMIKANDFEIGLFESQFNARHVKQMLYRNYAFPVTEVFHYVKNLDDRASKDVLESLTGKCSVEFSLYIDCVLHEAYATIAGKTLPAIEYPFDEVLMTTFAWDVGFVRQFTTSMFDLLYPIQREINRIAAKKQQIIRMYKGSVPVFNSDVDIAMKAISNGAGEALYIDSSRSTTELMTVINPTPLDPQLDAEIQSHKTTMYELAGIQNASFDMENMKSAAAVVALDQTRDSVFQAQLSGLSQFIKDMLTMYVHYLSVFPHVYASDKEVDWSVMYDLITNAYINMQPVHLNDPLSDEQSSDEASTDYMSLMYARTILHIIKGDIEYASLPYYIDPGSISIAIAGMLLKFEALGIDVPLRIHVFLMQAFVDAVRDGRAKL